jgi:hypothetical protein
MTDKATTRMIVALELAQKLTVPTTIARPTNKPTKAPQPIRMRVSWEFAADIVSFFELIKC